jgi:uncharacterized protein
MEIKHNMIGWIEIPVSDISRATKFYENLFDIKLISNTMGELNMAIFPFIENSIGSACSLVYHKDYYKPSQDGVLIYFTAISGDIDIELSRVEPNGGKVIMAKTLISKEIGYMAILIDTEGNRVALHTH